MEIDGNKFDYEGGFQVDVSRLDSLQIRQVITHTIQTDRLRAHPLRSILVQHGAKFTEVRRWFFGLDLVIEEPSPELMATLKEWFAEQESREAW